MILERAARCRQVAEALRNLAERLEAHQAGMGKSRSLDDEARELRALADQVAKLS
jgi:hypothetical protein